MIKGYAVDDSILPGLPSDLIRACYASAPGNEIESGKFASPESSAALAANTFGLFLDRPSDFPSLSQDEALGWPVRSVSLEAIVRFPWQGGRHPCLDALVETNDALIGIESKRYEPFRSKSDAELSDAYRRPVWGDSMTGYENVRDALRDNSALFTRLDAAQLVKHAFGLRTAVHKTERWYDKRPLLFYVFAEPTRWPDGRVVPKADIEMHRGEIRQFAELVKADEVSFRYLSYREMLALWSTSPNALVRDHAAVILARFSP